MKKTLGLIFLIPSIALASFCGTNTIPPDVRLAQTGSLTSYISIHQFRMTNTTSRDENYHLCRSLLVNSKESQQQKYDGDCTDITIKAGSTSPVIELRSIVYTTILGKDRMIAHAAVSSIEGGCKTSDLKTSKTYIYANPPYGSGIK